MADPIPPDATSIFFYSPQHQRVRDEGRMPRLSYVTDDGAKAPYTKEIVVAQPDAQAQIAAYQKQFSDNHIVGYGTSSTQKLVSAAPTAALTMLP